MGTVACMKDLSIFAALSAEEKRRVTELARKRVYETGEILFHQGDRADTIYLIKSGRVQLFKVSEEGEYFTLAILGPDELCGENSLFSNGEYLFSARALEPAFVCSCSQGDFQQLLAEKPAVAMKVIQTLGQRLNQYIEQMASLAMEDVRNRLWRAFQYLGREYGTRTSRGIRLEVRLTQQELASLVGATRVMVSHALKKLRRDGLVDFDGKYYYLLGPE